MFLFREPTWPAACTQTVAAGELVSASAAQRPPCPTLKFSISPLSLCHPLAWIILESCLSSSQWGGQEVALQTSHATRASVTCRHPTHPGLCSSWHFLDPSAQPYLWCCASVSLSHPSTCSVSVPWTSLWTWAAFWAISAPLLRPDLWFPGNPGYRLSISTRHIGLRDVSSPFLRGFPYSFSGSFP